MCVVGFEFFLKAKIMMLEKKTFETAVIWDWQQMS